MIFKRKKKKLENFNALGLINDIALPLTPFGEKITNSDVVLICPFATASSSSFSVENLKHLSSEANWLEGRRFRPNEINEETVYSWVDSLNLD